MPRHIIDRARSAKSHRRLVEVLAKELGQRRGDPQPYIVERQIAVTGSRHVHVIWDELGALPDIDRSELIVEAYQQHEGEGAKNISVATGLTAREALALGLLPFKITPTRRADDRFSPKQYEQAMNQEAKHTVLRSVTLGQLRYPTLDDADQGSARLHAALPGSKWVVVQEVPIEG